MLTRRIATFNNGINYDFLNPILTIAIPTYNRPERILEQVTGLIPQITDEVRLIVQDNLSERPVESLFGDDIKKKCTFLRNKYNIGADANIAKCFELCESPWLLVLGDDDPVEDFAVATILEDIKNSEPGRIFICYDWKQRYVAHGLDGFLAHCDNRYWCLFWMSGNVYQLPLLKEYLHQYFYSISTMQPGIVLLVNALANHPEYSIEVTGKRIHKIAGPDVHWNREAYIYASLFMFDVLFRYRYRLESTLFHTVADLLYRHVIKIIKSEHNFSHAFGLMMRITKRRGIINTLHYDFHWFIRCLYHIIVRS